MQDGAQGIDVGRRVFIGDVKRLERGHGISVTGLNYATRSPPLCSREAVDRSLFASTAKRRSGFLLDRPYEKSLDDAGLAACFRANSTETVYRPFRS